MRPISVESDSKKIKTKRNWHFAICNDISSDDGEFIWLLDVVSDGSLLFNVKRFLNFKTSVRKNFIFLHHHLFIPKWKYIESQFRCVIIMNFRFTTLSRKNNLKKWGAEPRKIKSDKNQIIYENSIKRNGNCGKCVGLFRIKKAKREVYYLLTIGLLFEFEIKIKRKSWEFLLLIDDIQKVLF